jgi:hypothetical protein
MHSRHHVVEFLLSVIRFVIPIWKLAAPMLDKDRGFYTEISDRISEIESEILNWQGKPADCVIKDPDLMFNCGCKKNVT